MSETQERVTDFDELYPGRFIKAGDLKGKDVNLTITKVVRESLEGSKGKQKRGVLSFKEIDRELVLNRTNGECIKAMFGRDLTKWIGHRITVYPAKIQSEIADLAIRVRGSPDLKADVTFSLALARKRPRDVVLKKTAGKPGVPAPEPEPDEETADAADVLAGDPIIDQATGEAF